MLCASCRSENREGRRFCSKCGAALAAVCPSCGFTNEPGDEFCGGCGTRDPGMAQSLLRGGDVHAAGPAAIGTRNAVRHSVAVHPGGTTISGELVGSNASSDAEPEKDPFGASLSFSPAPGMPR
jgi:hypothetical protein